MAGTRTGATDKPKETEGADETKKTDETKDTKEPEAQSSDVEAAKAEAERIISDAKKAVADMLKNAEETIGKMAGKKADSQTTATQKTKKKTAKAKGKQVDPNDPMRLVPVTLFKDNKRYKDDLFVNLESGKFRKTYQIQRGKQVMVPYCVAKKIEEMQQQGNKAAMLIDKLRNQYQENKTRLGDEG